MAKKNKQTVSKPGMLKPGMISISRTGKMIILAGIGIVAIGFFILTKTDPHGQNWASNVSPFLILGGYALIGVGIVFPDKESETSS